MLLRDRCQPGVRHLTRCTDPLIEANEHQATLLDYRLGQGSHLGTRMSRCQHFKPSNCREPPGALVRDQFPSSLVNAEAFAIHLWIEFAKRGHNFGDCLHSLRLSVATLLLQVHQVRSGEGEDAADD